MTHMAAAVSLQAHTSTQTAVSPDSCLIIKLLVCGNANKFFFSECWLCAARLELERAPPFDTARFRVPTHQDVPHARAQRSGAPIDLERHARDCTSQP
jgi:hypothetical protein